MMIVFANAGTATQLMIAGFIMVFFVQVAGNAMQIFASEVFPTNARASGFGWAAGVGRLATAFIMPTILWVQNGYGLTTVFVCLAMLLVIAAAAVTQLGPEAGRKASTRSRRRPADLAEYANVRGPVACTGPGLGNSTARASVSTNEQTSRRDRQQHQFPRRAATRAAGSMACRSSSTRATPISVTCSATASPSSTCATRKIRSRSPSSPRRRTRARIICRFPATSCWRSTARISGRCRNIDQQGRYYVKSLAESVQDRAAVRRRHARVRHLQAGRPREIAYLDMPGFGAHRIWWVGGRYAYVSVHFEGFIDHALAVIDMADPAKPKLAGRWWLPGMNRGGGETPPASFGKRTRCIT